jgi:hypothetical protein
MFLYLSEIYVGRLTPYDRVGELDVGELDIG